MKDGERIKRMNRPNILLLTSDQHSASALSCAGHPVVKTPNIDRIANEGVRMSNTYCPMPLCVPSRTASLTGRYGHSTGVMWNSSKLMGGEPTFPQLFQDAGYCTSIVGKIHMGQRVKPGSPECYEWLQEKGFEDPMPQSGKVYAALGEVDCSYRRHLKEKGVFEKFANDYEKRRQEGSLWHVSPSVLDEEDYHDIFISRTTIDWLEDYDSDRPFFCWCNWGGPHAPWDAPGRYAHMYDPDEIDEPIFDEMQDAPHKIRELQGETMENMPAGAWKRCRASYYGMISAIDDSVGEMIETLKKKDMLDNTIIVYTSDHGEMLYDHGIQGKVVMYEGSVKVPMVIRSPSEVVRGETYEGLTSALDLIPFLLEMAQISCPDWLQGVSFRSALENKQKMHREEVFSEIGSPGAGQGVHGVGHMKMVRSGNWKYIYNPWWETQQLFNLTDDPHELNNLVGREGFADKEREMKGYLLDWMIESENSPHSF